MTARIVVLGAGAAGLAAANRLRAQTEKTEIVLADRSAHHYYQPGFTSVMFADASLADIRRPVTELLAPDIRFVSGEITQIRAAESTVTGSFGDFEYDYLIVALGVDFDEAHQEERCAPWSPAGAVTCARRLTSIGPGDTVLVSVAGLPYRCPPAPFDLALRIKHRTGAQVTVAHPWPKPLAPFGDKPVAVMEGLFAEAGIEYGGGSGSHDGEFDLNLVVPRHLPPAALAGSGLRGASGWMDVDHPTFENREFGDVFGIGDVVAPPLGLGMAGTLGVFEAGHVADVITRRLEDADEVGPPRLEAICFMHMGDKGSFMHCDFAPVLEGEAPSCVIMPEMPYFLRARSAFAEEWFGSIIRGGVR